MRSNPNIRACQGRVVLTFWEVWAQFRTCLPFAHCHILILGSKCWDGRRTRSSGLFGPSSRKIWEVDFTSRSQTDNHQGALSAHEFISPRLRHCLRASPSKKNRMVATYGSVNFLVATFQKVKTNKQKPKLKKQNEPHVFERKSFQRVINTKFMSILVPPIGTVEPPFSTSQCR